ncbi:MAG: hypothetical protein K8T25_20825 [Planctomycetia bacterium]|nr:hypothetical protein [Planctomycetia bacterium]
MMRPSKTTFAAMVAVAIFFSSCQRAKVPESFSDAIRRADKVTLYEGLPHPQFERELLAEERRTKPVQELSGYPFYREQLALSGEDATRLSNLLRDSAAYRPPTDAVKACAEFHPDYAVEWSVGAERYRALICFGCSEVVLFGPGVEVQNDLENAAIEKLQGVLKNYRKNRPAVKKPSASSP